MASGGAYAQIGASPAGSAARRGPAAGSGKPAPQGMGEARRHYENAVQLFKEGRYDSARVEFETSYSLSNEPDLLYNLSMTAEKQGLLPDAIRYAEQYLAAKPNAKELLRVRERIARLKAQQSPEIADLSAVAPPPSVASQAGASAADKRKSNGSSLPKAPIGVLAAGGGILLAGLGLSAAALATEKQIEGMEQIYFRDLQDLQQRGNTLSTAGRILTLTGAAAVLAGGCWLISLKTNARDATQP